MQQTLIFLLTLTAMASAAAAQIYTDIVDFDLHHVGNSNVVQGPDGNLYGTSGGGANGLGEIYKLSKSRILTTVHNFSGADGANPAAGLMVATDGNLYGTTTAGGTNNMGTVFKLTVGGVYTVLYSFLGPPNDGAQPQAPLIQGSDGYLYGTTYSGGDGPYGTQGTVFRITLSGVETVLHNFDGSDGQFPDAALTEAENGNLYGTTQSGGAAGTIFEITSAGQFSTVHFFSPGQEGCCSTGPLLQANDNNLYSTLPLKGPNSGGTFYRLTLDGTLTVIYSFPHGGGDGPGVVQGTDGEFYGTAFSGGVYDFGTAFKITSTGAVTILHNFRGPDGSHPQSALLQATNGTFYGTTKEGGSIGGGVLYSIDTGLSPFVSLVGNPRSAGRTFGILGQDFIGTSAVTLNGAPVSFTVKGDGYISATVPAGATTGFVTVTTPGGTLTSNTPLYVLP